MTDDDIIRMYQELLRQAPENKDLKESIKRWHRRKEVRSQRASPPPRRTLDALKELLTESLRQNPDKRPSPDLPIDAEISKLLDKGATYLDGRQAVVDGCMWGDYYARSPNRPANLTTWRVGKAKRERQATGLR